MDKSVIGVVLNSLLNTYNSGGCDSMSDEDVNELLDTLAALKDRIEDKQDKVLTIEETRRYLNCSRQTINNYIKEGKLKPKKHLGGAIEFKLKDLKALIKNNNLK